MAFALARRVASSLSALKRRPRSSFAGFAERSRERLAVCSGRAICARRKQQPCGEPQKLCGSQT
jgi:hypothetical protein